MSQLKLHEDDSLTLLVGHRKINFSKKLLMLQSDYFYVMFSRNFNESNKRIITLQGIDEEAMEDLLQVLLDISYFKKITDISKVIVLSDMFLFDTIKTKLIEKTIESLSLNNCLQIWMKLEFISVIPLVWKAKSMSLTNFNPLRKFGLLNSLELSELVTYLGHINLQCEREIDVFYTILQWISFNNRSKVSLQNILGDVINYNDISISELNEMKSCKEVMKYPDIVEILDFLTYLKHGKNVLQENKNAEIARSWLPSQGRYLPNYLCVLNYEQGLEIFCHGFHKDGYLNKLATVPDELSKIVGFEIQVYKMKIYIFGGELSIGKGIWNEKFWQYDFETQRLNNTKYGFPIKRRHFKSCVAADFLYIIGGTGGYRVRKNDMFYFNFKSEKWETHTVALPCCQTSLKFCDFNGKLFILDCHFKNAFIFVNTQSRWLCVKISESVIFDEFSSFSIFSYRRSLFFKGKKLVELEYIDDSLKPIKENEIPNYTAKVLIETKSSNNRVYSAYAHHISGEVSLEFLNLDNLTSLFFEKISLVDSNKSFEAVSKLTYNPNLTMKMFMLHHHKLVFSEDILVD